MFHIDGSEESGRNSVSEPHPAELPRRRFEGVSQILIYNWHFYAAALTLDLAIALLLIKLPINAAWRPALYLIAIPPTFWALSSIFVSHYVYDRSPLYRWQWLQTVLDRDAGSWLNIHAGLDQSTAPLSRIFPDAQITSLDIYTPTEMSEPSIARARRRAPAASDQTANPAALPFADAAFHTVMLIFAAHELRSHDAKLALFRELHRILKPKGRIVLVEHLRDWKNFLAYGPGFLHFFSRREWLAVCNEAGLGLFHERTVTPFIKCMALARSDQPTEPSPQRGALR